MLNALPTDKKEILLIAHNSDYDCRFILECLQHVKPIVKGGRFLQIKATYYNPKAKKTINIIVKDSYKLIPMALIEFGKCFKLDVNKEVMPYNVYTYEHVNMGACSIQSALDTLKDDDKQHFSDNLEKWGCILGKGMDNQMFDLIKYSKDKIIKGFSEILKSSKDCKFNNCNHINNDGCNVIKDLLDGVIDKSRYNNFIKFRDS